MRKKQVEAFRRAYMQLDTHCSEKFGISRGGVTEYINRLNNAKYAHGRDEVLPHLVKYRNVCNKLMPDYGTIHAFDEIGAADIQWVKRFDKDIVRRKDPISRYLRRAHRAERRHGFLVKLTVFGILLGILLLIALFYIIFG